MPEVTDLEGSTAKKILATMIRAHSPGSEEDAAIGFEFVRAVAEAVGAERPLEQATEEDVARETLRFLSGDPEMAHRIRQLAEGRAPEAYGIETTALTIGGIAFLLQSYVRAERDMAGRWKVTFVKEPMSDGLLKALIEKLIGLFGVGNGPKTS